MIIQGDSLQVLRSFKPNSIDMCMTSPPYWGLRDYGHDNQLGLEKTPEEYIEKMTAVFSEVKRVLKAEGTLWIVIGDTYNSGTQFNNHTGLEEADRYNELGNGKKWAGHRKDIASLPSKCLCMIPERLAWSLIQDGWILRNKIVWYKPNGMPSSVKDRFSNKWEYIFLFSKSRKYYFDLDAVREELAESTWRDIRSGCKISRKDTKCHKLVESNIHGRGGIGDPSKTRAELLNPLGKNPGDVFTINTQPFPQAHFAVFPEKLCEKPIKAGCPEGGTVLDPFCGAGTVGVVAKKLQRKFIGIDIKSEYTKMSEKRIKNTQAQLDLIK